jgi:hypothetical protein
LLRWTKHCNQAGAVSMSGFGLSAAATKAQALPGL